MTSEVAEGTKVWQPSARRRAESEVARWAAHLAESGLEVGADYSDLFAWSVAQPEEFWTQIWTFAGLGDRPTGPVSVGSTMPGVRWFPEATVNYAAHALRRDDNDIAIIYRSETETASLTWAELNDEVRRAAAGLRRIGVGVNDRVAGYLTNRLESVVAFLATASLGAIWTACSPDFGTGAVLDRFAQVEPVVLIAASGYTYAGTHRDRSAVVAELVAGLPSLRAVVEIDDSAASSRSVPSVGWHELTADDGTGLTFTPVPFDHPLWIVYTSGTTGVPKSIVHGHGGVILEHTKLLRLHLDLSPGDRFMWFTTTGWVMWNILVGGLLCGVSIVLCDGDPTWPDPERLWQLAAETRTTFLGLSAGFLHLAQRTEQQPAAGRDLSSLRSLGVTGSPLSPSCYGWIYGELDPGIFLASISGGTDVCTAFVGSVPTLPVHAGRLQARCLGVAATCLDPSGRELVDEMGELVVTAPMPSMPIAFWNDPDGQRYRESYFSTYPGKWRHGDWITITSAGECVLFGRSDATLNRGGVRMGTGDFYRVLDTMPAVADSVVIDTTALDSPASELVLIVAPAEGYTLDEPDAQANIVAMLRSQLSPRHVPDLIVVVHSLPHTLNGKRLEVPIRRLFLGAEPDTVVDLSAIDDPGSLRELAAAAAQWRTSRLAPSA